MGTLDDKGARELALFVASSPENAEEFKSELHLLSEKSAANQEAEAFLERCRRASAAGKRSRRRRNFAISASAVLVAALLPLMLVHRTPSDDAAVQEEVAVPSLLAEADGCGNVPASAAAPASDATASVFVAPASTLRKLTLPDGSVVTLHKGSKLEMDPEFGRGSRTVRLDGEAFFDVAKDQSRPFRILCGEKTFVVKGTSFNIISYAEDKFSVVTLHTGSLAAHIKDNTLLLTPGDELCVDDEEDNITRRKVDVRNSIRWMNDDALSFRSLPLKMVAAQLGHKYGVRVCVHPSISDILYDGEIDDEPLDVALRLLAITAPQKLEVNKLNDTDYYISKQKI